ncbi:dehydratase [Parashewanella spongiae]|uniref:Dehydratase n=1 Tax=Parashewanella spongiae TaxID=342950 RepID=A0A3A6TWX3_9GAMM|nr:MaoC/PaaZ C-terminal domain-containing protein [Parashewanella spongiae]MCL1076973.1 dehydratase [Parashewanella spongiae]RJY18953.1 dehydratase [Parashewanella spongiae]
MPSLFSLYRKIFFARKPGWDNKPLPFIRMSLDNVELNRKKVVQYAQVCGFEFKDNIVPPTYLHVIMFRLHAAIFTQDSVTFPLLGMIHLKNKIHHYRNINVSEKVNTICELVSSDLTDSGLEFVLHSKAFIDHELVWESTSTYLYRVEGGKRKRPPRANSIDFSNAKPIVLSSDLGWKYARASDDYNLIHLHPMLSKRFGFEKVLAHGMWSKACCMSKLSSNLKSEKFSIDVEFKLPIFMPSEIGFCQDVNEDLVVFELRDKKGKRPHLSGTLTYL